MRRVAERGRWRAPLRLIWRIDPRRGAALCGEHRQAAAAAEMNGRGRLAHLVVVLSQNPAVFRVDQESSCAGNASYRLKAFAVLNIWIIGNPTLNLQAFNRAAEDDRWHAVKYSGHPAGA